MQLSDPQRQALRQILETSQTLEGWRARSRQVEVPQSGSEAASDDDIWPWLPPSEIARQSLIASTQHLNLARTAIEVGDIYPSSHFTVVRGGLVGACQAVWILGPNDRAERQQRALRVIDEWYFRALQYGEQWLSLVPEDVDMTERRGAAGHMRMRKQEARDRWARTDGLSATQTLALTDVVVWSARHVLRDPAQAELVKPLWQQLSGDAHALGWSVLARSTLAESLRDGMGVFQAGGDLEHVRDAYMVSFKILKAGWSLFDRRCEGE